MKKDLLYQIALQRLAYNEPSAVFSCEGTAPRKRVVILREDKDDLEEISKREWSIIHQKSQCYPEMLKQIVKCPPVLLVDGNPDILAKPSIAIIGARKAAPKAREIAHKLAYDFAKIGFVIVSGLAYGIDSSAHNGAIDAGGETVAVLGCGLDVDYPARNAHLKRRIRKNGAIISEFPLGTSAYASNFPRRNRIISGLSAGIIVVQAALKSGSIITAKYALEQNKDVFVVKPEIRTVYTEGNFILLEQGAKVVQNAQDITGDINLGFYIITGHERNKEIVDG